MTISVQTLSESDRRLVAEWAAACAERVLPLFEAESPNDDRPRAAIARTRALLAESWTLLLKYADGLVEAAPPVM